MVSEGEGWRGGRKGRNREERRWRTEGEWRADSSLGAYLLTSVSHSGRADLPITHACPFPTRSHHTHNRKNLNLMIAWTPEPEHQLRPVSGPIN